jgi:Fusaric acid resistance protein-like
MGAEPDRSSVPSGWLGRLRAAEPVRELLIEAFAVEERKVDVWSGLAGAIATAAPAAIGVATGDRGAGLIAAIGGLNTALVVPRAGLRSRLWWGSIGAVGGIAGIVLATLATTHTWVLTVVTFAWVASWALLRAAGPRGALAGFAIGAVFVIVAGIPPHELSLGSRTLWFTVGAAFGLTLMVAARRGVDPPEPVARTSLEDLRDAVRHDRALRVHAVRLGLAVALATLLERALKMPHGYWVPLTVLAIVQPAERATEVRCVQRAAGTVVGVVAIIAVTSLTSAVWALVVCTGLAALGLFALDERGYFWLVVMLTPAALLLLSIADFQGFEVGVQRTLNSALGILLGLAIGETAWRLGARHPPHS